MLRSKPASPGPQSSAGARQLSSSSAIRSLSLEVRRGETRFPRRPVSTDRFLIGSGAQCDLQLAGNRIPTLHSLIRFDGDLYELDAIADAPQILVNGAPVLSTALLPGDEIEIGDFLFGVVDEAAQIETLKPIPVQSEDFGPPVGLDELTAEQLVDLIDRESDSVSRSERNRTLGAMALLQAAAAQRVHHRDAATRSSSIPFSPVSRHVPHGEAATANNATAGSLAELEQEIANVVHELQLFSQELSARFTSLRERENIYAGGVATLADAQQRLMTQLERLVHQVSVLQKRTEEPPQTRAIA